MAVDDEDERGRHAAHIARTSHGRGGGHAAPGLSRAARQGANSARGARAPARSFIARQARQQGAWDNPSTELDEEDDVAAQHPLYQGLKFPEYSYQEYPKHVYPDPANPTKYVQVNNEEEEHAVMGGEPLVREEDERERMLAIADVKQIQVDKRWGVEKLRKALVAAGADPAFDPRA